jgi:hypothetical protein
LLASWSEDPLGVICKRLYAAEIARRISGRVSQPSKSGGSEEFGKLRKASPARKAGALEKRVPR